jgi:hypothetical protein
MKERVSSARLRETMSAGKPCLLTDEELYVLEDNLLEARDRIVELEKERDEARAVLLEISQRHNAVDKNGKLLPGCACTVCTISRRAARAAVEFKP